MEQGRTAKQIQPTVQSDPWSWRVLARTLRIQSVHLLVLLSALSLMALLLSSLAVGLQSRRDEARTADVLLVVARAPFNPALGEAAFELARRGYAPEVVVLGPGSAMLRATLLERGLPEASVLLGSERDDELAALQDGARAAFGRGASTAVVLGESADLLLWLKVVDDHGLRPYGAPVPGDEPSPLVILTAGVRYWLYALLQI